MCKSFKYFKYITISLVMLCLIFTSSLSYAYDTPVTEVTIGSNNENIDPIFKSDGLNGQGTWYPGYSSSGILRLKNGRNKSIKIKNIGMDASLEKNGTTLDFENESAMAYMSKMKIKVQYKSLFSKIIKGTIYDGSFYEFINGVNTSIKIGKDDTVDLVYTIKMDESAGNNTEGIKGNIDFTVSLKENTSNTNTNTDTGGTTRKKKPVKHWAHDCIETLLEKGIIKGYPDGTIRPDNHITRAEASALVCRALKLEVKKQWLPKYLDISGHWAQGYITSTTNEKVFKGYPGFVFRPERNIIREEMSAVLFRAFDRELQKDLELEFTDNDKISDWAKSHVKIGVEHKIIVGYPDNTFKPRNDITRAEAFTMICKLLGYHSEH